MRGTYSKFRDNEPHYRDTKSKYFEMLIRNFDIISRNFEISGRKIKDMPGPNAFRTYILSELHQLTKLCTATAQTALQSLYSRTPMVRTPLEPCIYIRDRGSSS